MATSPSPATPLGPRPQFDFPVIHENPCGWGPSEVPEQFKDTPYQPFSTGDRLGKVADWSGSLYQDRRSANKYGNVYGVGGKEYIYHHAEDESTFQLVDTSRLQKHMYQKPRAKFNQQKIRRDREKREERRMGGKQQVGKGKLRDIDRARQQHHKRMKKFMRHGNYDRNPVTMKPRQPSLKVRSSWEVKYEIEFNQLSKLNFKPPDAEELRIAGTLGIYDSTKEKKIGIKTPHVLNVYDRVYHKVTTTDDPVIRDLAKSPECSDCRVFATDTILATLMTCARSKYSWDIVADRIGNFLFLDKRDDSQFDYLTVSETAKDPPQEEEGMNCPQNLSIEATYVNQNFSQQMLLEGKTYNLPHPNPFSGEDPGSEEPGKVASVAYRYLKWQLGGDIGLVARCEFDAIMPGTSGNCYINIKALNEWDPKQSGGVDWRKKLDSQRGAVLATELKNNSCKIAKWAMCSILAGSSFIKFGYVSRKHPVDPKTHQILGVQQVKPAELADQMMLDVPNAWGVLHAIVDACLEQPEGKYVILKDPNQAVIRIYQIPSEALDSESESSSEESEEEEDLN